MKLIDLFNNHSSTKIPADSNNSHLNLPQFILNTIEDMSDGCEIIDKNYTHLYVNKALVRQSQTTEDKLINHTMMEAYPGIESTDTFKILKEAMDNRTFRNAETEFTFPNGVKKWFELRIEPIPIGLIIFSIDITDRKNQFKDLMSKNQELEEVNRNQTESSKTMERFLEDLDKTKKRIEHDKVLDEAILSSIGEGLFAVDKNNQFILINRKAEELSGLNASDFLGKETPSILPVEYENGDPVSESERPTDIVLKTGKSFYSNKLVFIRRDGTKFPLSLTVAPIKINDEIIGAIDVFRDITEEKQIDKAKSEFVTVASHQLRTPLGVTRWYIDAIISDKNMANLSKDLQEKLYVISRNNQRLLALVRNLLSVSRIDTGEVADKNELVDVRLVINESVKTAQENFADKKLEFKVTIGDGLSSIYMDLFKFKEIVDNLISNAVIYNKTEGSVEINAEKAQNDLVLTVKDTGIGITTDDQDQIYSKFFRSDKAISTSPDGSGLSLFVVKSYLDRWGGSIKVKSEVDKGSTFTVSIPIKQTSVSLK